MLVANQLQKLFAEQNSVDSSIAELVFANTSLHTITLRNATINRDLQDRFNRHTQMNHPNTATTAQIGFLSQSLKSITNSSDEPNNDKDQCHCLIS